MTTRLDEIEREAREVAKYMDGTVDIDCTTTGDILALVAVARTTIKCRRIRLEMARKRDEEWDRLASQLLIAEAEESAALAPLLAPVGADHE
jgi:hypothetical protein